MYSILSKEMLTPNICKMKVYAPRLASSAAPGQFLIVRADEKGERIPLTISDFDTKEGSVTIVTQSIGSSTMAINGTLGNASDMCKMTEEELSNSRYVFIAGGVGTAPVYPQVKWLHEHGVPCDVIIGARNKDLLIYTEEIASVADNLYLCTDDGSVGFHGVGTAKLEALVAEGKQYTRCVAIGPMIMMKFATLTCRKLGIPVTVSLNTLMVDGTGMCGACRVTVGGKTRFACVEGPEFDGYEVDFDEAMRRQTMYKSEETAAREDHVCRIGRGQ